MAIRGLSIYLLKETVQDPTACINFENATELETLAIPGTGPWHLAIRHGKEDYPDWAYFFSGLVDLDLIGKTKSVGALLLIPAVDPWFGLTFGTADIYFCQAPGKRGLDFGLP
jgi:uncharacterized protein (TIGR04141 family)